MYPNGKMTSVKTTPGMEGMMEGMNSTIIYLIYCKNICKCYNVLPAQ
jgi:hypothetical protein